MRLSIHVHRFDHPQPFVFRVVTWPLIRPSHPGRSLFIWNNSLPQRLYPEIIHVVESKKRTQQVVPPSPPGVNTVGTYRSIIENLLLCFTSKVSVTKPFRAFFSSMVYNWSVAFLECRIIASIIEVCSRCPSTLLPALCMQHFREVVACVEIRVTGTGDRRFNNDIQFARVDTGVGQPVFTDNLTL